MSNTDTSWILEANDRGNFIDGTLYVPFGMYDEDNEVAVESLQVVSNQSYWWTVRQLIARRRNPIEVEVSILFAPTLLY